MSDSSAKPQKPKKPKKEKKPKEKPLSFRRVMANNFFVLKIIWKTAPLYLPTWYLWSIFATLLDFFSETYMLRYVVNGLQDGLPTRRIMGFIVLMIVLQIIHFILISVVRRFYYPRINQRIVARLEKMLFDKARQVEIACYEKPEFYDKYVRSMENIYTKSMEETYLS